MTEYLPPERMAEAMTLIHDAMLAEGGLSTDVTADLRRHFADRLAEDLAKRRTARLRAGLKTMLREGLGVPGSPGHAALCAALATRFGIQVEDRRQTDIARIEAVLARGRIGSVAEYRLLRDLYDRIEGLEEHAPLETALQAMLGAFETRRRKK